MRIQELQYDLPPELIAQRPAEPRDASRLMILDRRSCRTAHRRFSDICAYLSTGDVLVLNDTRVIPARFFCRRQTGGRVEGLFLRDLDDCWSVLLKPSARLNPGQRLRCTAGNIETSSETQPGTGPDASSNVELVLVEPGTRGQWLVRPDPPTPWLELLERVGQTPLPPYVRPDAAGRTGAPDAADRERYQTVYADRPGAVAAPTAGLHFTPALLQAIQACGVNTVRATLHVGLGTFAPIDVQDLAEHKMHSEWFEISDDALATIQTARAAGGRIIAVGTTAVRILESLPNLDGPGRSGWTNIFIYPPYTFRHVDALITNFHLPGSTLLALVMAFVGPDQILTAYREAIAQQYRFYSYGDAMLLL